MSLVTMDFESQYLNGQTTISVILPDFLKYSPYTFMSQPAQPAREFYESDRKYKVLWLLHGTFGDHSDWLRRSNIELYACEKDLIVVMPSALNSDYSNWDNCMVGYSAFDYLVEELMPLGDEIVVDLVLLVYERRAHAIVTHELDDDSAARAS